MVRVIGAFPIRLVTGDASRRQAGKDIVFVADVAPHAQVRARQSEFCLGGMVKDSAVPAHGYRMAHRTVLGKSRGRMVGIGGVFPIRLMAGDAGCRQTCIHTALMARVAGDIRVRACQRELGRGVVVEWRIGPRCRAMADRAILWETCRCVIWVIDAIKISGVAGHACRAERGELIVYMARLASDCHVGSAQSKLGLAVIKLGPKPLCGRMAGLAVLREARGDVARIIRAAQIRLVA